MLRRSRLWHSCLWKTLKCLFVKEEVDEIMGKRWWAQIVSGMKCYSSALRKTKFNLVEQDCNITRLPQATWSDSNVDMALSSRGLGTFQGPFTPKWFCVLTRQPFRRQYGNIYTNAILGPFWWQDTRCMSAFLPFTLYPGNSLNTWATREAHLLLHLAAAPEVPALWLLRLNWVVTQSYTDFSMHITSAHSPVVWGSFELTLHHSANSMSRKQLVTSSYSRSQS